MKKLIQGGIPIALALLLAGCGGGSGNTAVNQAAAETGEAHGETAEGHHAEGLVELTPQQIQAAGIEVVRPVVSGGGTLTLPATIEGDPERTQVVSAAVGGRVVALNRNLGQPVARGQVIAIIESREVASLKAEVEAARARLTLAESNLAREERLFKLRVSPERDVIAARTAATEARIAHRRAQQELSAAGVGGGSLNRIGIRAPISGQVTARPAMLGQTVAADAELFRISDLSRVSVKIALSPADAARVKVGTPVEINSAGRRTAGRISFVSPVLDETTRMATVLVVIDNRGGEWRVGEPVTAVISLPSQGATSITVPSSAIQTVENRTVVFVRTREGFKAVPVTIGGNAGGSVLITAGLTGSEEIAGANSFTLKSALGAAEAGHED